MYRSLMALIERVADAPCGPPEVAGLVSDLSSVPAPLLSAVETGECFLFAGEGLGHASGVPNWTDFLAGLIDYLADGLLISRRDCAELRESWANGRYERVAHSIRDKVLNADRHSIAYARMLYGLPTPLDATLEALANIPFGAAVTPNLDTLVERVTDFEAFSAKDALLMEDRLAESVPFVLKLRGILGKPSAQVWQDLAFNSMNAQCAEVLREMFRSRTMLAVGVTPNELHRWLDAAAIGHVDRTHYLITTPGDRELKRKAESLYRRYHVQVLTPTEDETSEVLLFLHKLGVREKFSN